MTKIKMTVVGIGVKIRPDQKIWLEENAINTSKFLRNAIDREMAKEKKHD